jgi:hypothetical protein
LIGRRIYFIGGYGAGLNNKEVTQAQLDAVKVIEYYDLDTENVGQWSEQLATSRVDHRIVLLDKDLILVAGGSSKFHVGNKMGTQCVDCLANMEVLDTKAQSVTASKATLPMAATGFSLTKLDTVKRNGSEYERFLFLGGNSSDVDSKMQSGIIWSQFKGK